jgi:glycerol kinase
MGNYITSSKTWNPNMSNETRINSLKSWYKAIEKAKNWL